MGLFFNKKEFKQELEAAFKANNEKTLAELNTARLDLQQARNELATKQRVIDEQKAKLRDQNEADIFLMCDKIKNDILNGKKKEEMVSDLNALALLQNQQRSLNVAPLGIGLLGGAFGSTRQY